MRSPKVPNHEILGAQHLRTVPTFVGAHMFCASRKPWFSSTRALGLTLTQSTTLSRTQQNESKIFLL